MFSATGTIILSGFLTGAYENHATMITMVKSNKDLKNNSRDIFVGFFLVFLTFVIIGCTFYLTYPGWKSCIADVFIHVSKH